MLFAIRRLYGDGGGMLSQAQLSVFPFLSSTSFGSAVCVREDVMVAPLILSPLIPVLCLSNVHSLSHLFYYFCDLCG